MNKDGIYSYSGLQLVLDCESGYTNTFGGDFSVAIGLIHFNNLLQRELFVLTSAGDMKKIALMIKTTRCLRGYNMMKTTQNNKTAGRRSTVPRERFGLSTKGL